MDYRLQSLFNINQKYSPICSSCIQPGGNVCGISFVEFTIFKK